jgi:hypothetical protein
MNTELLYSFLESAEDDARISCAHISLYVALWKKFVDNNYEQPISFFRNELVCTCKIAGTNLYHRAIRQLHEYGYLKYIPSYNHFLGSMVYFV